MGLLLGSHFNAFSSTSVEQIIMVDWMRLTHAARAGEEQRTEKTIAPTKSPNEISYISYSSTNQLPNASRRVH